MKKVEFQNNQTGALMKVSTKLAKKVKFSTNGLKMNNGLDFFKNSASWILCRYIEFRKFNVG
jgi:hypothetical protein